MSTSWMAELTHNDAIVRDRPVDVCIVDVAARATFKFESLESQ
jgi:hypothetical protein